LYDEAELNRLLVAGGFAVKFLATEQGVAARALGQCVCGTVSMTASWPVIVGAGAALLAALMAAFTTLSTASKERALNTRQRELDLRREQVNGLYGPLMMWREVSSQLHKVLPTNSDGSRWALVDHIEDVQKITSPPEWRAAAEEIIEIGRKVDALLIDKAGMSSMPRSVIAVRLLVVRWRGL
jgi:hypothetical protein